MRITLSHHVLVWSGESVRSLSICSLGEGTKECQTECKVFKTTPWEVACLSEIPCTMVGSIVKEQFEKEAIKSNAISGSEHSSSLSAVARRANNWRMESLYQKIMGFKQHTIAQVANRKKLKKNIMEKFHYPRFSCDYQPLTTMGSSVNYA